MNKKIFAIISSFYVTLCSQPDSQFLEKIAAIKKDLYKIPAHQLCEMLAIPYGQIPVITAQQLQQEMGGQTNLLVINVLPEYYYNDCHIKGSINAPLKELIDHAQSWDQSRKIIVYCALDECDAGEKGCILLSCMGFTDIYDYKGGIKEWFQLGYPIEGPALSDYLHTKSLSSFDQEYTLYPQSIVCSRQTRWQHRY